MKLEQALALRDLIIPCFQRKAGDLARGVLNSDISLADREDHIRRIGEILPLASLVYWREELFRAAGSGTKAWVDRLATNEDTLVEPQLWFFEGSLRPTEEARLAYGMPPGMRIVCMFLTPGRWLEPARGPDDQGKVWLGPGYEQSGLPAVFPSIIHDARRDYTRPYEPALDTTPPLAVVLLPPLVLGQPISKTSANFAAPLAFLRQEFVAQERAVLPRHLRRAAQLGRRPPLPREINVVTLRRTAREEKQNGAGEPREWSCQWLVGAHWRKQLCKSLTKPGEYEYRPCYVRPYLKGDPTKPLREPKGSVYLVNR